MSLMRSMGFHLAEVLGVWSVLMGNKVEGRVSGVHMGKSI